MTFEAPGEEFLAKQEEAKVKAEQRQRQFEFTRSIAESIQSHEGKTVLEREVEDALRLSKNQLAEKGTLPCEEGYAYVAKRENLKGLKGVRLQGAVSLDNPTQFETNPGSGQYNALPNRNTLHEFSSRIRSVGWFEPLGDSMYICVDDTGELIACERNQINLDLMVSKGYKLLQKQPDQEGSTLYPDLPKGRQIRSAFSSTFDIMRRHAQERKPVETAALHTQEQKLAKPKQ